MLHVHVVYSHCASWVICSLPKTLSGQCNLSSTVEQKIKHVYILCMYTVNVHKLFCRFKSECSMPPRRNRIPNEVRRRIVRAFEDPTEDYLSVADTLGVNRSTARSIVATYLHEGRVNERPRGGRNNVRVDNEMRDCINEILNENCLLTLQQINEELRRRLSAKRLVCDITIEETMDGMLISVKMAIAVPVARIRPDVIERRYECANCL